MRASRACLLVSARRVPLRLRCLSARRSRAFGETGLVLVPFPGAGVYALIRPCEERLEVKARRLRMQMLERSLAEPAERCPECAAPLAPEFRCCAVCGAHLRTECDGCGGLM